MTRIFGYSARPSISQHDLLGLRERLIARVGEAIEYTYDREDNWQAGRLGILMSDSGKLIVERNLIGYRGVRGGFLNNLTEGARSFLMEMPPLNVIVCVMNEPDEGIESFTNEYPIFSGKDPVGLGDMFYCQPFEGGFDGDEWSRMQHEWLVFTSGSWSSDLDAESEKQYLSGTPKPSYSILNYLAGVHSYSRPDFSWINAERMPVVLAYNRNSNCIRFHDGLTGANDEGWRYVVNEQLKFTEYCGKQDKNGKII